MESLVPKATSNPNEAIKQLNNIYLFLGTYEGRVIRVEYIISEDKITSFSFKVSESSVRSILNESRFLFVSGNDEIIRIYDIINLKEEGMVVTYNGTINTILKHKNFLLASGDNTSIDIWRMQDFTKIHILKGHKASITSMVITKNGKLLISTGKDNKLLFWNLLKGTKLFRYSFKDSTCNKLLLTNSDKLLVCLCDSKIIFLDITTKSVNFEEYIVAKLENFKYKILDAFVIKNKLIVFKALTFEVEVFDNFTDAIANKVELISFKFQLEYPGEFTDNKDNVNELRVKIVNTISNKRISIVNIVYSNNEIILYDINKIFKEINEKKVESTKILEFKTINLLSNARITSIASSIN